MTTHVLVPRDELEALGRALRGSGHADLVERVGLWLRTCVETVPPALVADVPTSFEDAGPWLARVLSPVEVVTQADEIVVRMRGGAEIARIDTLHGQWWADFAGESMCATDIGDLACELRARIPSMVAGLQDEAAARVQAARRRLRGARWGRS